MCKLLFLILVTLPFLVLVYLHLGDPIEKLYFSQTLSTTDSEVPAPRPVASNTTSSFMTVKKAFEGICSVKSRGEEPAANLIPIEFDLATPDQDSQKSFCSPGLYASLNFEPKINMCVYKPEQDQFISASILNGNVWDDKMVEQLTHILRDRPSGLVIDAGANIGQISFISAALGHQVLSFEPVHDNVELFRKSVALNPPFSERIHLFKNGLGRDRAQVTVHIDDRNRGGSRLGRRSVETNISIVRLDDMLAYVNEHFSGLELLAMKVDIEGFEPLLFQGAMAFLSSRMPPWIFMEVQAHAWMSNDCDVLKTLQAFKAIGYDVQVMDRNLDGPELVNFVDNAFFQNTEDIVLHLKRPENQ